jgi:hypothetical protein
MSSTDLQYTQPLDSSTLEVWRNLASVSLSHDNIRLESVRPEHFDGLFAVGGQVCVEIAFFVFVRLFCLH